MLKVALTGGVACGKSTVGSLMADQGASVLDSDDIAHQLMEPGQQVYADVVNRFGREILKEDESIDRSLLAKRVFADTAELEVLNKIVHPEVKRMWQEWLIGIKGLVAIVIIPLLYEIEEVRGWDAIVCVTSPEDLQITRMAERGILRDDAIKRMRSQMPLEFKAKESDFVITNNDSIENLRIQTMKVWNKITEI